jgi:hypothetical protein
MVTEKAMAMGMETVVIVRLRFVVKRRQKAAGRRQTAIRLRRVSVEPRRYENPVGGGERLALEGPKG